MKSKKKRNVKHTFRQTLLTFFFSLILFGFYWVGDHVTTASLPSANEPPLIYCNQCQDDLQLTFTAAIKQAKKSILLIIYALNDSKIIETLKEKSEEGVPVKVICDGKASPFVDRRLGPSIDVLKRFSDGLMHLKILVVDDAQVFIGSANMTTDSLKMNGNLVYAFQSDSLGEFIQQKAKEIPEQGEGKKILHRNFLVGGQTAEVWFLPDDPEALHRIQALINAAKKTIRIAMYTWTRMDLAQAVVQAAKRGVKVEVVIDHYSGRGCGSKVSNFLKKQGIPVYFNQNKALLHHKFLYIDHHTLVNGSANWTKAAFRQNDDCFVVLYPLAEPQLNQVDKLWKVLLSEAERQ